LRREKKEKRSIRQIRGVRWEYALSRYLLIIFINVAMGNSNTANSLFTKINGITIPGLLIFIAAPCVLISPKFFIHQQKHFLLILENSKIYIKTDIKIAPTCFGLRPSSGSLHLSMAKVTLMLKQSVKLHRYVLCGGVAACCCKLPDDGRRPKHVGAILV
jgi:hypothetical protein